MDELAIETIGGRTRFEPGETVDLLVAWKLEGEPEAIEVRAAWRTEGKGTRDLAVVKTERLDHLPASGGQRVRFTLPVSPYSFSGKLISLGWFLEVVALPSKEGKSIEIVIAPGGQEVLLYRRASEEAAAGGAGVGRVG